MSTVTLKDSPVKFLHCFEERFSIGYHTRRTENGSAETFLCMSFAHRLDMFDKRKSRTIIRSKIDALMQNRKKPTYTVNVIHASQFNDEEFVEFRRKIESEIMTFANQVAERQNWIQDSLTNNQIFVNLVEFISNLD